MYEPGPDPDQHHNGRMGMWGEREGLHTRWGTSFKGPEAEMPPTSILGDNEEAGMLNLCSEERALNPKQLFQTVHDLTSSGCATLVRLLMTSSRS
eukprot:scaffold4111_cov132-Isochrysis_galbana.AAC.3